MMEGTLRRVGAALAFACVAAPGPVAAQMVYRCGNSYSQAPCAGGSTVDVSDSRTPAQKSQAEAAARQTAALATRMQQERLAEERALAHSRAALQAGDKPSSVRKAAKPADAASAAHARRKPAKGVPELFTAAAPTEDGPPPEKPAKAPARPTKAP